MHTVLTFVDNRYLGTKTVYNTHSPYRGAVAQLGERFNGIEEGRSSSLLSSTIIPVLCLSVGLIASAGASVFASFLFAKSSFPSNEKEG